MSIYPLSLSPLEVLAMRQYSGLSLSSLPFTFTWTAQPHREDFNSALQRAFPHLRSTYGEEIIEIASAMRSADITIELHMYKDASSNIVKAQLFRRRNDCWLAAQGGSLESDAGLPVRITKIDFRDMGDALASVMPPATSGTNSLRVQQLIQKYFDTPECFHNDLREEQKAHPKACFPTTQYQCNAMSQVRISRRRVPTDEDIPNEWLIVTLDSAKGERYRVIQKDGYADVIGCDSTVMSREINEVIAGYVRILKAAG